MNNDPEKQFKKYLIIVIVVFIVIICAIVKPDFFGSRNGNNGLELSSDKPWKEEFAQEYEKIDDVDIQFTYPENEFKKEESEIEKEDSLKSGFEHDNDDKYWVTGSIPINPMSDLNKKTKSEIYSQRKNFVETSIFKSMRYKPSESVFGKIDDKKPWLGIESLTCYGKNSNSAAGLSEESRYINNPTMLIGLDRVNFDEKAKKLCSVTDYLMPVKINYSKDENTIKVVFEVSAYKGNLGSEFLLKGLNAKDLGFKYAYADEAQNVVFLQQDKNISKNPYMFKDFIQVGMACGLKGGCNNGSPFQKELNYIVMKYPATIHFKLWKKAPKNKEAKADINYLIILK